MEEKCVRAIVGGTLERYRSCQKSGGVVTSPDETGHDSAKQAAALESARRSLGRVHDLLERLTASLKDPWIFETMAYFQASIGQDEQVYENLMKEYRSLQTVRGWEKDEHQVQKICQVVTQIVRLSQPSTSPPATTTAIKDENDNGNKPRAKEKLAKTKFLLAGVIQRIKQARRDLSYKVPEGVTNLELLLGEVTRQLEDFS